MKQLTKRFFPHVQYVEGDGMELMEVKITSNEQRIEGDGDSVKGISKAMTSDSEGDEDEDEAAEESIMQPPQNYNQLQTSLAKICPKSRQQMMQNRIQTIQAILPNTILKAGQEGKKISFKEDTKPLTSKPVSDIVLQYQTKIQRIAHDGDISEEESSECGTIPLDEWCKIACEENPRSD